MKRRRGKFAVKRGSDVIRGVVDVQASHPARESSDALEALKRTGNLVPTDDLHLVIRHERGES